MDLRRFKLLVIDTKQKRAEDEKKAQEIAMKRSQDPHVIKGNIAKEYYAKYGSEFEEEFPPRQLGGDWINIFEVPEGMDEEGLNTFIDENLDPEYENAEQFRNEYWLIHPQQKTITKSQKAPPKAQHNTRGKSQKKNK